MAKYNSGLKYNSGSKYNTWGIALFYSVVENIGIQETVYWARLRIKMVLENLGIQETVHWLKSSILAKVIHEQIGYQGITAKASNMCRIVSELLWGDEILNKVSVYVRSVIESTGITDMSALVKDIYKIFTEPLSLRDRWRRWRYNSGIKYNQRKKYGGYVAYVLTRRRNIFASISLALAEKIRPARVRFRHIVEIQSLVEILDRAIGKWRSITIAITVTELASYTRNRFYSVIDDIGFTESISRLRQALLTLLGKAQTRFSFVARAVAVERFLGIAKTIVENVTALDMVTVVGAKIQTRQVIYCQLGGGDALVKLDIFRGNDKTFELNVKDESGVNLDLTGATVIFMVKQTVKDADIDAVIIKTSADETEIKLTQPILGTCEIYLKPDDTKNLPVKHYVYEAQVITAGGRKYTVAMDEFILKHVVKRD